MVALGDTQSRMHQRRGIHLHGHTVGATGIETMVIHTSLRSKNKRSTFQRQIQAQGIADRQLLGSQNIGQQFPAPASLAPAQPAQGLRGDILFLDPIRVSQAVPPATQVFDNSRSQRQLWQLAADTARQFPETSRPQRTPHPCVAVPEQQGALGDVRQCRHRPWQFARSGIRVEVQMA